jgi:type VI secretion system protein VasG
MIDAILTNTLLPRISRELLERISQQVPVSTVTLGVESSDLRYEFA